VHGSCSTAHEHVRTTARQRSSTWRSVWAVWRSFLPAAIDVEPVRIAFMQSINGQHLGPDTSMTLTEFVECVYLPWAAEEHRASTSKGYREIWRITSAIVSANFVFVKFVLFTSAGC